MENVLHVVRLRKYSSVTKFTSFTRIEWLDTFRIMFVSFTFYPTTLSLIISGRQNVEYLKRWDQVSKEWILHSKQPVRADIDYQIPESFGLQYQNPRSKHTQHHFLYHEIARIAEIS